jgi:isoquinoline 1-oxidoreductase beta subunit
MQTTNTSNINRRNFLRITGITSTGFILGLSVRGNERAVANLSYAAEGFELSPYIMIEKSGAITMFNTRPEIGQGVHQSVPAMMAEELEVSLDQVTVVQTGGEKKFGPMQFAGGSMSIRSAYTDTRKVGAAAREMLIKAASQQWNVPVAECYAENAKVFHKPTGKSIGYGDLSEAASKLEVPKEPTLKDPKDFKILGKSMPKADTPLEIFGKSNVWN